MYLSRVKCIASEAEKCIQVAHIVFLYRRLAFAKKHGENVQVDWAQHVGSSEGHFQQSQSLISWLQGVPFVIPVKGEATILLGIPIGAARAYIFQGL